MTTDPFISGAKATNMNPETLFQIKVKFLDGSSYLNTPATLAHCRRTQQEMLDKEKARFMRFANGIVVNLNNVTTIEIVESTDQPLKELAEQILEDF